MFENNTFDFCYSMICFQHIPDVRVVRNYLSEISRVLKPDGYLRLQVTQEPAWGVFGTVRRVARRLLRGDRSALQPEAFRTWQLERTVDFMGNRYTRSALNRLLRDAGLAPVAWHPSLGLPDWLWVTAVKQTA